MNNPYNTILSAQDAAVPDPLSTVDIPPALASMLNTGSSASINDGARTFIPSYQAGGVIGPGGVPVNSGLDSVPANAGLQDNAQSSAISPQMLEMQVSQFANQHPQQVAQIRAAIQEVMATGELTPQELNMIVQLATVAAQNPEMYPYVRNFAIQQGIATEQDLPPQYDQGLVFVLLLAARAIQADIGGQDITQGGVPALADGQSIPSRKNGGTTPQSKNPDGSVLINAHEGEYVIPKHVVEMKGREFFDSLIEKYKDRA